MKKNESGQIIVILAVALVAILGITALAVDGSMIYAERRDDQSTADSAALAAAQAASASPTCATAQGQAISTAQQYASQYEGVVLANDTTSPSRVEATCNADNSKLTIKVMVTSNTNTTFAKMVSRNQLQTRVESMSQVTFGSSSKFAGGNGIVTLGVGCDTSNKWETNMGGMMLHANAKVIVKGGGVYSRSCIFVDNAPAALMTDGPAITYAGDGDRPFNANGEPESTGTNGIIFRQNAQSFMISDPNLTMPSVGYQLSECQDSPCGVLLANSAISKEKWPKNIDPITSYDTLTIPDMVGQVCSANDSDYKDLNIPWSATEITVQPGYYNNINQGWTNVKFVSGVYCIKNGGSVSLSGPTVSADNTYWYFMPPKQGVVDKGGSFSKSGDSYKLHLDGSSVYINKGDFKITGGAILEANNTTIFVKQGNVEISGNVDTLLTAPDCISTNCTVSHAIPGVAIYVKDALDSTSISTVWIAGSSNLQLEGTIFAPKSLLKITGHSTLKTLHTQVICKTFETEGSSPVTFDLVDANLYSDGSSTTASVELLK